MIQWKVAKDLSANRSDKSIITLRKTASSQLVLRVTRKPLVTVSFFWRWLVVHAWTSGPYANFWNLKIFNIVETYNPGKAEGPDNFTSRILKELHSEIAPVLTDIFNASFSESTVPNGWKNAYVTPVYKRTKIKTWKVSPYLPDLRMLQGHRTQCNFQYHGPSWQK